MPDIRMSEQVRHHLGSEMISNVLAAPLSQARCPVCRASVPAEGPVNVVVSIGALSSRITFTHTRCAPSALMAEGDIDLSDLLPDEASMRMTAALIAHGTALLPVLTAEVPVLAYTAPTPGGSGEVTDMIVSTLLARGLALTSRVREAPRPMLNWSATLVPAPVGVSHLVIEAGHPEDLFYDGGVALPGGWRAAVERFGWCVLYGGSNLSDPGTEDITVRTLRAAAAAGTLVGGRLQITWGLAA